MSYPFLIILWLLFVVAVYFIVSGLTYKGDDLSETVEKRCSKCSYRSICWKDWELGIWSAKNLKCSDIRELLEEQLKELEFER